MRLVLIGLVAGLFSALFGVGGGIVIVPLLIVVVRFPPHAATATSIAAILATALVGTISYAAHGEVKPGAALLVGLPGAAGAVLGSALQQRLPRRALSLLFAALLAAIGIRLLLASGLHVSGHFAVAIALGFAGGVLAGLFGVGGGLVFVPTLLALGLTQLHAEATSLLAILPTAAAATWRQHRYNNVRWRAAATIGLASIAGVEGGVLIAESLPEQTLRRLFGGLLIAVALQLAWRERSPRAYS